MAVAARDNIFPTTSTRAAARRSAGSVVTCGGILWRQGANERIEVCLSSAGDSFGRHFWTIPRGRVQEDERLEDAAIRQVYDKTGSLGRMPKSLERVTLDGGEIGYFFLLRAGKPVADDRSSPESHWVELTTAIRLVRTEGERNSLVQAAQLISARSSSLRPV